MVFHLPHAVIVLLNVFVAFPGILRWQNRLWLTLRNFLNIRNQLEEKIPESVVETAEFKKHEAYMFDSRNYYLKGVTFNYTSAFQLSVAISKMQGLTNSIRVSYYFKQCLETSGLFIKIKGKPGKV